MFNFKLKSNDLNGPWASCLCGFWNSMYAGNPWFTVDIFYDWYFSTYFFLYIFFQISTNVHSRLIIVTRMPSVLIQKAISRALVKLDLVVTVIFAQVCIASLVKFYKKNYFHTVKKGMDVQKLFCTLLFNDA